MGGMNSGRRSGRATVERSLAFDIHRLLRFGQLRPGETTRGTLVWQSDPGGETMGSVSFLADLRDPHGATMRLLYRVNGRQVDCEVSLETQPMPFGGARWWWTCPRSGRRAAKLFLSPETGRFMHRQAAGLAYQSWRDAPMQRGHNRMRRLYRRLGGRYEGMATPIPARPKGMHAATYAETCAAILNCEGRIDGAFCAATNGFLRRVEARLEGRRTPLAGPPRARVSRRR